MARISFTANLARHREIPSLTAGGETLREVLDAALAADPLLKGYLLDEQGRLRKHVNIFIDGEMVKDRLRLSDPAREGAEIYVMQALSGG